MDPSDKAVEALCDWVDGDTGGSPPEDLDPDIVAAATVLRPDLAGGFQPDVARLRERLSASAVAASPRPPIRGVVTAGPQPANNTRWFARAAVAAAVLAVTVGGVFRFGTTQSDSQRQAVAQVDRADPWAPGGSDPYQSVALDLRTPVGPADGSGLEDSVGRAAPHPTADGSAHSSDLQVTGDGHGAVKVGAALPDTANPALAGVPGILTAFEGIVGRHHVVLEDGLVQSSTVQFRFAERAPDTATNGGPFPEQRAQATVDRLRAVLTSAGQALEPQTGGCTAAGVRHRITLEPADGGAWVVVMSAYRDERCL